MRRGIFGRRIIIPFFGGRLGRLFRSYGGELVILLAAIFFFFFFFFFEKKGEGGRLGCGLEWLKDWWRGRR